MHVHFALLVYGVRTPVSIKLWVVVFFSRQTHIDTNENNIAAAGEAKNRRLEGGLLDLSSFFKKKGGEISQAWSHLNGI